MKKSYRYTCFSREERLKDIKHWMDISSLLISSATTNDLERERKKADEYRYKYHRHNKKAVVKVITNTLEHIYGKDLINELTEIGENAVNWIKRNADEWSDTDSNKEIKDNPNYYIGSYNLAGGLKKKHIFNHETLISYTTYLDDNSNVDYLIVIIKIILGVELKSLSRITRNYIEFEYKDTKATILRKIRAFIMPEFSKSTSTKQLIHGYKAHLFRRLASLKEQYDADKDSGCLLEYNSLVEYICNLPDHEYYLMCSKRERLTDLEWLSMKNRNNI